MKEALDFQLNEKKRKQQEEKQRQNEWDKREEERIRKEMQDIKHKHDKEVQESSKKMSHRSETTESYLFNQSNANTNNKPMTSSKQFTSKPEVISSASELRKSTEVRESPSLKPVAMAKSTLKNSNVFTLQDSDEEKTPIPSIVAVSGRKESGIYKLVDENKKLRDENTKKEELIDVLISALKHKGINTPNSQISASNLSSAKTRDVNPNQNNFSGKPPKPTLEKFETETDLYGYYLNKYTTHKNKMIDIKDSSYSINEDKNYSTGYDLIEPRDTADSRHNLMKKAQEFTVENLRNISSINNNNNSFFKNIATPTLRTSDSASNLAGAPLNPRVYSSPLSNHFNKNSLSSMGGKLEIKSGPYIPYTPGSFIPTSAGVTPTEAFKGFTQNGLNIVKGNITPHKDAISNESSIIRIKKRYEHSVDFIDLNQDSKQDLKPLKSYRPIINILKEDGTASLLKANQSRKDFYSINHPGTSPAYISYDGKNHDQEHPKYTVIDTALSRATVYTPTQSQLNSLQNTAKQSNNPLKLTAKINSYDTALERKAQEEFAKSNWGFNSQNQSHKDDAMSGLPRLDSRPKFPKEVFSLNLKKRACP